MIIAGTGHRPQKLGGFKLPNPTYNYVCQQIEKHFLELKPEKVISGMALGYDQWLAVIAIKLKISLIAAVPFEGQEKAWNAESQTIYKKILSKASEVVIVSDGGYANWKMQVRNEWMVNHADLMLACYDGSAGGTANCINYAKKIGKELIIINPLDI